MRRAIGITTAERIATAVIEGDQVIGSMRRYPEEGTAADELMGMPAEHVAHTIREQIEAVLEGKTIDVVGVGIPGIVRNGVIEESPNLQQLKGCRMQELLSSELRE